MTRVAVAVLLPLMALGPAFAEPPTLREHRVPSTSTTDDRDAGTSAIANAPLPPLPPVGAAEAAPLKLGRASDGWATLRLIGVLVVLVLSVPFVLLARRRKGGLAELVAKSGWLGQLVAEPAAPADRIDIVSRRSLSQREWLAVVRVGDERFLLAANPVRVSLLSRLANAPAPPAPADFATELRARSSDAPIDGPPTTGTSEDALRSAVARARARLSRASSLVDEEAAPRA
jgi:hypothetical protein